MTRVEGEGSTYQMERLALDRLIAEVIEDCEIEAAIRRNELVLRGSSAVFLFANRELLRRAIENVIRNAIHHAPSGTKIEVAMKAGSQTACVSVRDYGPGVPTEDLVNIFKPFFKIDESRNPISGGVGLGLSIAERAIYVHRGQIWAENAEPGLRVWLDLPLKDSDPPVKSSS